MGADSKIEWTHHTFNPWWGCTRVSPGCEHCYAETFAKRVGVKWGVQADRRFFGEKHWREPLKWNAAAEKAGERHRVFCASMADVFEDRPELQSWREQLWGLIEQTPNLDWLLLTKRPENLERMLPWCTSCGDQCFDKPMHNVWLGTTVEDQRRANERIPHLLRVPAAVRFLSVEPQLGHVDLRAVEWPRKGGHRVDVLRFGYWSIPEKIGVTGFVNHSDMHEDFGHPIDWVIVGGESGHGARRFDAGWARSLVEQCKAANVPVLVKQMGANVVDRNDRFNTCGDTSPECDGDWPLDDPDAVEEDINGFREAYQGAPVRIRLRDRKGGSMDEWPPALRVREYPKALR